MVALYVVFLVGRVLTAVVLRNVVGIFVGKLGPMIIREVIDQNIRTTNRSRGSSQRGSRMPLLLVLLYVQDHCHMVDHLLSPQGRDLKQGK